MKFSNKFSTVALLAVFAMPLASQAAATSVADLWGAISFGDVISAIFGIGALVIGVDLAQLGYMKVRRLVKGAH